MGLDLYAGSLTRYYVGDWLTVVARAAMESGTPLRVIRPDGREHESAVQDPDEVHGAVLAWRHDLSVALNKTLDWPEAGDAPYATDKPAWDGRGALLLLAAYDDRPDLRPEKKRWFSRSHGADATDLADDSVVVQAIRESGETRYPALLLGAEWWLPSDVPTLFEATTVAGPIARMSSTERLLEELAELNRRTLTLSGTDLEHARSGDPDNPATVQSAAFGLAVFTTLAQWAVDHRQPLLMDY